MDVSYARLSTRESPEIELKKAPNKMLEDDCYQAG